MKHGVGNRSVGPLYGSLRQIVLVGSFNGLPTLVS